MSCWLHGARCGTKLWERAVIRQSFFTYTVIVFHILPHLNCLITNYCFVCQGYIYSILTVLVLAAEWHMTCRKFCCNNSEKFILVTQFNLKNCEEIGWLNKQNLALVVVAAAAAVIQRMLPVRCVQVRALRRHADVKCMRSLESVLVMYNITRVSRGLCQVR